MRSSSGQRGLEDGLPEDVGFSRERLQRLSDELKREVEQGLLPGAVTLIARHAKVIHFEAVGWRDREARAPMSTDAIFRIASMSKPITSVAAMTLVEQGKLHLENPVAAYLPQFTGIEVAVPRPDSGGGTPARKRAAALEHTPAGERASPPERAPALGRVLAVRPPSVHDLLRHTAGLTYQFFDTPVGRLYLEADLRGRDRSNADFASALAALPLAYQPGAGWNYSHATDLLGCVVEAVSGRSLFEWEEQEILGPLGMADTSFWISDPRKHGRVAEAAAPDNRSFGAPLYDPRLPRVGQMGGTGMQSTALDYARFLQMLLNGGAYEGRRVLSPTTVTFMTSDHLGTAIGAGPTDYIPGPGYGFGLGFAVRRAAGEAPYAGSVGMYSWAGSAGTLFWCDPRNDLLAVVLAQAPQQVNRLIPLMANMVYAALVEPEK